MPVNPLYLNPSLYCTTDEACAILGITRSGIIQARDKGKINTVKFGSTIMWNRESVEAYRKTRGTFPVYTPGGSK